jgi:UDP-3-O-[3-hydroxymyristoyl] glucosamine N-acyltransferase
MIINHTFLSDNTGLIFNQIFECDAMGMSNATIPNTLSFLDSAKFLDDVNNNNNITVVLTLPELKDSILNKTVIVCEDPRFYFYTTLNKLGKTTYQQKPTVISPSATIHPNAFISPYNVVIGDRTIVGPNVTILSDVEIGDDCIFLSGVIVGSEGFEYKRTSKGILPVFHDGKVIIGNKVEVGANTCIVKGFSFRNTIIDDESKFDNLIHVAHGVQIGKRCFVTACATLAGSSTLKDDVWIGPNATISSGIIVENNAYVTIGSVVTRHVSEGQVVTGNFAIEHKKFLEFIKQLSKS